MGYKKELDYKYNYNSDTYKEPESVTQAKTALQNNDKNKPGAYSFSQSNQYQNVMDKILNREKFSYDLNGDALYNQYKNQYMKQGQMAMQDTMGQGAALTGGYGNSYAQTAGQSMYNQYLGQLNDKIPELYQLALDKYNQDTNDLYNQFSMLSDANNTEYGMYRDKVGDWQTDRSYLTDMYNTESDRAYNRFADQRDFGYGVYADTMNFNYNQDADNRAFGYQQDRDLVSDNQWQQQFDYNREQDAIANSQWQQQFDYNKEQDAIANSQWQQEFDYNKEQDALSYAANQAASVVIPENTLTESQLSNMETYADNADQLANYLLGLVDNGVIDDATADYYFYKYFPKQTEEPNIEKGKTRYSGTPVTVFENLYNFKRKEK